VHFALFFIQEFWRKQTFSVKFWHRRMKTASRLQYEATAAADSAPPELSAAAAKAAAMAATDSGVAGGNSAAMARLEQMKGRLRAVKALLLLVV
jgi:hypothetical protein